MVYIYRERMNLSCCVFYSAIWNQLTYILMDINENEIILMLTDCMLSEKKYIDVQIIFAPPTVWSRAEITYNIIWGSKNDWGTVWCNKKNSNIVRFDFESWRSLSHGSKSKECLTNYIQERSYQQIILYVICKTCKIIMSKLYLHLLRLALITFNLISFFII